MRIYSFRGWRPRPDLAAQLASRPYDVVTTDEAAKLAEGKPYSFYHVTRSEIDLPAGTDLYDPQVYEKAAENFRRFCHEEALTQDEQPSLYLYRLTMGAIEPPGGGHAQTGLVCCLGVDDYDNNVIKKHELTRRDKEEDRTRHILATRAHCGPVLIAYRRREGLDRLVEQDTAGEPLYDFVAEDGVRHTVWKVTHPKPFTEAFRPVPAAYIADGHHRAASAARVRARLRAENPAHRGDEEYNRFLAVVFPDAQLQILAYNRVVKGLNGQTLRQFLDAVGRVFAVATDAPATPDRPGRISMLLGDRWYGLSVPAELAEAADPVARLDVSILQQALLDPVLGIKDPRGDKRIDFIGGVHGTDALVERVRSGTADVAFSLHPVRVQDLMAIADAGGVMPPKSTWFEPKLRSGLVVHTI